MSDETTTSEAAPVGHGVPGRMVVAALPAAYGVVVAVANARNDVVTADFTPRSDWVLFGGDSGFPDDFGRNVFAGSVGLGVLFVGLAVLVAVVGGTRVARPLGIVAGAFSVLLVLTFRETGNLLGAKPSAAAVLLTVALYLVASSLPVPEASRQSGSGTRSTA